MSEFCLECLKQFEPNANELNTVLSNYSTLCEGCGQIKQMVIAFKDIENDNKIRSTVMKNAKLIIDGKEIEVQISEEDFKELTTTKKITGYERVENEQYYYDKGYGVVPIVDTRSSVSNELYDSANYYSNINVANNNTRADKLMRQLRRFAVEHREKDIDWTDGNQNKYYIYYNYKDSGFLIDYANHYRDFGQIYFDTEETAKLAVKTFKDELLWYFTEYYDSL